MPKPTVVWHGIRSVILAGLVRRTGLQGRIHDPGPVAFEFLLGNVGERSFGAGDLADQLGRRRQFAQIPGRAQHHRKNASVLVAIVRGGRGALLRRCLGHQALDFGQLGNRAGRSGSRRRRQKMRRIVKLRRLQETWIGGKSRRRQKAQRRHRAQDTFVHQKLAFRLT
jgi:hypothetical protein